MMCRFVDREDDGYIKVKGVLTKYMQDGKEQSKFNIVVCYPIAVFILCPTQNPVLDMRQEKL